MSSQRYCFLKSYGIKCKHHVLEATTLRKVIMMDAMFTLFVALLNRWHLYQEVLRKEVGIEAQPQEIESVYTIERKKASANEKKPEGKLPPGYYGNYWSLINAKLVWHFLPDLAEEEAMRYGRKIYAQVMGNPEYYRLADGTIEFLQFARAEGYLLGLATNQQVDTLQVMLNEFKINQYFDLLAVSDDIGYTKPDPRFFYEAMILFCEYTGQMLTCEDFAVIGNNPDNDMAGAAAAGIPNRFLLDPEDEHKNTERTVTSIPIRSLGDCLQYF